MKKLERAKGIDTSDLAAEKHFITLKDEIDKLNIFKMVNVTTIFNTFF